MLRLIERRSRCVNDTFFNVRNGRRCFLSRGLLTTGDSQECAVAGVGYRSPKCRRPRNLSATQSLFQWKPPWICRCDTGPMPRNERTASFDRLYMLQRTTPLTGNCVALRRVPWNPTERMHLQRSAASRLKWWLRAHASGPGSCSVHGQNTVWRLQDPYDESRPTKRARSHWRLRSYPIVLSMSCSLFQQIASASDSATFTLYISTG